MSKKINYRVWPLGKLQEKFRRPELKIIKKMGYKFDDAWDVVEIFEKKVAKFAGSKYAVAVDCCSHGIFLLLKFLMAKKTVIVPSNTYISVPMQILHAGCKIKFKKIKWSGIYKLDPYPIWDFAVRWTKNMFNGEFNVCSFQIKKHIPIGKGGMILTDSYKAYKWLQFARYDGRNIRVSYTNNKFKNIGWHYYMTPEDAARGIILMERKPEINEDMSDYTNYSDLSNLKVFK
tara:strand:- start:573 stop:1268 length:696 start_codon:yes stop_codon:yes gene_type:complete